MQLKSFRFLFRFFSLTILGVLIAAYFVNFRILSHAAPGLEITPFGYNFKGHGFTGILFSFFPNKKLERISFHYAGKRHGPDIQWYGNGQRFIERNYSKGLEVGTHKSWYEDGNIRSVKVFVNGLAHGDFLDWHPNGTPSQFIHFEMGRETVAKSWTPHGKPFYNYTWRDGERVGLEGDSFCSPNTINF